MNQWFNILIEENGHGIMEEWIPAVEGDRELEAWVSGKPAVIANADRQPPSGYN